jgi:O-glycosyl hydrolase
MNFDVNSFLEQVRGGFGAQQQQGAEQLKQEQALEETQFKKQKNQLSILEQLARMFEIGRNKESNEPNPILAMLKKSMLPSGYEQEPMMDPAMFQDMPAEPTVPQEYAPMPEANPYQAPSSQVSSGANMNDMVGGITEGMDGMGGNQFLDSGTLQDYLKRYLQ